MSPTFIDTSASLVAFLNGLPDCKGQPPSLYVDREGNNLSRHGTLSIVTILVQPQSQTYLIDVTTLGRIAFTTEATNGLTLKAILESPDIIKVFFDIRNDSDALYSLHDIHVQDIEDLQLFELAARKYDTRCVNGLAKCIERDMALPYSETQQWQLKKNEGRRLFAPELGGSYAYFDQRPRSTAMIEYCAQDVVHMPRLREIYLNRLCDAWYVKIRDETEARIRLSQSSTFNGKGRHMALGPAGWSTYRPTLEEMQEKTMFQAAPSKLIPNSLDISTSPSKPVEEADRIAQALMDLPASARSTGSPRPSVVCDDDDDANEDSERWQSGPDDSSDAGTDSPRSYTACDLECGYCGKCPY